MGIGFYLTSILFNESHCYERGCEIIVGDKSHINLWEQGGVSQVSIDTFY